MSDATFFLDAVTAHVGTALERCRDRWGPATGLLADGYNLKSREPGHWEAAIVSDLSCQQNLIRSLDGLHQLTGADLWSDVADEWIGNALPKLTDAASNLWYWGGHTAWDLETDKILAGNHELKCVFPFYDFLYRVDAAATTKFIDAFWHAHIWDWSNLLFNRHGEYEQWNQDERFSGTFAGTGALPLIDNTALSFINTGSDLIYAGTEALRLNDDRVAYDWALHLLSCYEAIRHPETGLAGYQFNHRDPCRVRQSFVGQMGQQDDVNETTVITNNVIGTRYGRVAVCFLNQAMRLGDQARPLLEFVCKDLVALARHSWQGDEGIFQPRLNDGTLLTPAHTQDVGYCQPVKLRPVRANGLLLLSYARAYRVTGNDDFFQMAHAIAQAMGWGDVSSGPVDFQSLNSVSTPTEDTRAHGGQNDACALEALLDLYVASEDEVYMSSAISLGRRLVETHVVDGLFTSSGSSDNEQTGIDSAVPVALLRLAGTLSDSNEITPTLYPNITQFDPKVVVARRE